MKINQTKNLLCKSEASIFGIKAIRIGNPLLTLGLSRVKNKYHKIFLTSMQIIKKWLSWYIKTTWRVSFAKIIRVSYKHETTRLNSSRKERSNRQQFYQHERILSLRTRAKIKRVRTLEESSIIDFYPKSLVFAIPILLKLLLLLLLKQQDK